MLAKPILKRILHFRSLAMKYHKPFALDGVELVRRKVARAVVMGGAFADAAEPEYNFAMDPKAVLAFFRLWPREVEIAFSPAEVGDAISVRKQNGGTKHFDGTIALNIHILSSPSYFARDCFDKLFA